ncbi:membrane-bound PQQ-dependent dehydrogenase, glucose/quinate/shikimate family, partial [Nguyenibacter vanlangensis]|nr:membrane-bound PQQ-dependent dehydrogenase, glucose/quinate/shikimate family [Nguyenibacter vanlangensis]
MNMSQGLRPVLAITAAVCALIGLYLLAGGVWLTALGGSLYYVVAGIMLLVTAVLLLRRRQEALWVYAALLIGTMVWAVGEVGFDFWALAPRGDVLVPLGIWLLLPPVTRILGPATKAAHLPLGL